jgi:hypothetical protein
MLAALATAPAFLLANEFDGAVLRLMIGVAIAAPLYLLFSYVGNREWVVAMMELARRPRPLVNAED